jgi:transposase-like protein
VDDGGRDDGLGRGRPQAGRADVPAAQDRGRAAAVARRGPGDGLARALGVTAATLSGWRDAFLTAGGTALTTRPGTGEGLAAERLKAKLGEALIERDLLTEKIAALEAGRPLARQRRKR